ncbi:MAG: LruC domain-containing protein [Bacteroidales bacterium]|nr:LruC domain-containing protein [Bacteroidales bacterium]
MNFSKVFPILLVVFIFSSCLKEPETTLPETDQSVENLVIPSNFNWETDQLVNLKISVAATKSYEPKHRISVLSGNPADGGKLIAAGAAGAGDVFDIILGMPTYVKSIYLFCEGPFGSVETAIVPVSSGVVEYIFGSQKNSLPPGFSEIKYKDIGSGPDCDEGCDEEISGGGTVYINGGKTYCVKDNFSGYITFQSWNGGGTLRVCGTAIVWNNTLGLSDNCHIVVAEGGTFDAGVIDMGGNSSFTAYENTIVDITSFNAWSENSSIINYGDIIAWGGSNSYIKGSFENHSIIEFKKKLDLNGNTFINSGSLTVKKNFTSSNSGNLITNDGSMFMNENCEFNSNTLFINNDYFYVQKDLKVNDNTNFTNNGTVKINDDLEINSNSVLVNNCQITINDDTQFNSNADITLNTGYFKASDILETYTSVDIKMYDGSVFICYDLECGSTIKGFSGLNSILVTDDFDIWGSSKVNGNIEVATTSGTINGNSSSFVNGAYYTSLANAVNYLPISACNPDGFGTPTVVDTDLDGVPDELDDFPTDPERAFKNYFPSENGEITLAFEDLWPSRGDYDFNDLVVGVYGMDITNANDQMVEIYINFIVKAVGASNVNGFGFQLNDIPPDMIETVSGMVLEQGYVTLNANGTEANQSNAVIIVTESVEDVINRSEGSMFNTVVDNPAGTSDTTEILIHFTYPIDPSLINSNTYNPFVIKEMDRGIEIHLPNFHPTDLMNVSLLGTGNDASDPDLGKYYVTETNLPWGLMIMDVFEYPVEKSQIIDAYNYFGAWAESGGDSYPDWYLDISGYRNESEIYPYNTK